MFRVLGLMCLSADDALIEVVGVLSIEALNGLSAPTPFLI